MTIVDVFRAPPPEPEPAPAPAQTQTTPATPAPQSGGLQCDPPRSQLEAEQCAERQGQAPQNTPTPAPEPAPTPGICNDGQDNEGVPGLIDGDDPNCQ